MLNGGGGIRTPGAVSRTPVFKTGPFSRSGTPPERYCRTSPADQPSGPRAAVGPAVTTGRRHRPLRRPSPPAIAASGHQLDEHPPAQNGQPSQGDRYSSRIHRPVNEEQSASDPKRQKLRNGNGRPGRARGRMHHALAAKCRAGLLGETAMGRARREPAGQPASTRATDQPAQGLDARKIALLSPQAWGQIAGTLGLSPRELDIARHIFSDQTEAAIALALSISAHTVRTHTERLYRKLHVRSRVELVVRIVDEFLRLTADSASTLSPICAHRSAGRCPFDD